MALPETFLTEMQALLQDDYPAYLDSYEKGRFYGLRVNTDKISVDDFLKISPFKVHPIPWTRNGFYYDEGERPAKHPYYYAGLYYLQEPSAMLPAEALPVSDTDLVLDVCAAPGGKSTALLNKRPALLVSNDISSSRAQALLKNLELFGGSRMLCLSEDPNRLAARFAGFFDKILIDAPCSGEGMFRKDPAVVKSWEEHGHGFYVSLQRSIAKSCLLMLKPGGLLLYSTCTFSPLENEDTIAFMKSVCPGLTAIPFPEGDERMRSGVRRDGLTKEECRALKRIFPMDVDGEGHFVALLRKPGEEAGHVPAKERCLLSEMPGFTHLPAEAQEFLRRIGKSFQQGVFSLRNDKLSLVPDLTPDLTGLHVLRNGLFLGEVKKKRFEPSQALAMALSGEDFDNVISFPASDERVIRYIKGETVVLNGNEALNKGFVLVLTDGFPLGFAKKTGELLKNRYLPGWRMMGA